MVRWVENEGGVGGKNLDGGLYRRLFDGNLQAALKIAQCSPKLAIVERNDRGMVEAAPVQVDVESRVDSALTWRDSKCAHIPGRTR